MGYEIRKVPENWKHPKDANGLFIPKMEVAGGDFRGNCFQVYENVTLGTPISPIFKTKEECDQWFTRVFNPALRMRHKGTLVFTHSFIDSLIDGSWFPEDDMEDEDIEEFVGGKFRTTGSW